MQSRFGKKYADNFEKIFNSSKRLEDKGVEKKCITCRESITGQEWQTTDKGPVCFHCSAANL